MIDDKSDNDSVPSIDTLNDWSARPVWTMKAITSNPHPRVHRAHRRVRSTANTPTPNSPSKMSEATTVLSHPACRWIVHPTRNVQRFLTLTKKIRCHHGMIKRWSNKVMSISSVQDVATYHSWTYDSEGRFLKDGLASLVVRYVQSWNLLFHRNLMESFNPSSAFTRIPRFPSAMENQ